MKSNSKGGKLSRRKLTPLTSQKILRGDSISDIQQFHKNPLSRLVSDTSIATPKNDMQMAQSSMPEFNRNNLPVKKSVGKSITSERFFRNGEDKFEKYRDDHPNRVSPLYE